MRLVFTNQIQKYWRQHRELMVSLFHTHIKSVGLESDSINPQATLFTSQVVIMYVWCGVEKEINYQVF